MDADLVELRMLIVSSNGTASSVLDELPSAAGGANSGTNSDLLFDGSGGFSGEITLALQSTNHGGLSIDQPLFLGEIGGSVSLTAAGPITQTSGSYITAVDLTAATTGTTGSNDITLTNPNNDITGTARFNTASGNVSFTNGAEQIYTTIGNSNISGNLLVVAENSGINLNDASGTVSAFGTVTLNSSVGSINQSISLNATGVAASTGNGGIFLTNEGNEISGTVTLTTPGIDGGQGAFLNSNSTVPMTLGNTSVYGGLSVTTNGTLALAGNISAGGFSGSNVLLSGGTINQTSGSLSVSGVDSFKAEATQPAEGSQITLSLDSGNNAISVPVNLIGDNIVFNNSVDTTISSVGFLNSIGESIAATSAAIRVGENSIFLPGTINATGTVSLHAGGNILAANEGNFITAGTLILQSDAGVIGTTSRSISSAGDIIATTDNQDIGLGFQNSGNR